MDQLAQAIDWGILDNSRIPALPGRTPLNSTNTLGDIIVAAIPYLFTGAGLILLLYLIYGGYQYMLSKGDPAKLKETQAIITNAIVGFLVIFIAYWLVQAAGIVFGLPDIKNVFR